jgi:dehydrogenase/reductase SDR family protein 1
MELEGRVAIVTGASRGVGKGIATELEIAGATVYATARNGTPVALDHRDDAAVRGLFDRIGAEHGRLDILVNNVYSSPDSARWLGKPFWQVPVEAFDQEIGLSLRSHYLCSVLAVPLMRERSLIVNVSSPGAVRYMHYVLYGVAKAALDRMTADMSRELEGTGIAVISIWPGLVRTELLEAVPPGRDGRRVLTLPGEGAFDVDQAETPRFAGRAVVALASDPDIASRSGRAWPVADLAEIYGFTDVDGRVPRLATQRPAEV